MVAWGKRCVQEKWQCFTCHILMESWSAWASSQLGNPPVCPMASRAPLEECLPQVLPWLLAFVGLGDCLLQWLKQWGRGTEMLCCTVSLACEAPVKCCSLDPFKWWSFSWNVHCPRQKAVEAAAFSGRVMLCWRWGSSSTWRRPLLIFSLYGQGRISLGVGAMAAVLVQLELKATGVLAFPGEHRFAQAATADLEEAQVDDMWTGSPRVGAASESPQQTAVCLWPSQGTRQELTRNSVFSSLSSSLRWSLLWIRLFCSRRASEQEVSRSPIRQKTLSSITTVGTSAPSSSTMTLLKWVLAPQPLYYTHVPLVLTAVSLMLVSPQAGPLLAPWCICFPAPPVPGFCTSSPVSCCMQATKVHLAFPLKQILHLL